MNRTLYWYKPLKWRLAPTCPCLTMVLYQEFPPCPALAPYLACLWTCHVLPGPGGVTVTHRVLPDNCIDILWHDTAAPPKVAGMMSSMIAVAVTAPLRTIAVRFKPGAAAHFFALPLHEITDQHPALADLWGQGEAARFADALFGHSPNEPDAQPALARLQRLLLARLGLRPGTRPAPPRAGMIDAALAALDGAHGALRIESLATQLGVSRQHLAGQFRARVGLPPKLYARVCRFRAASARIRATPAQVLDFSALALELGYYDQPHLIHDFRTLAGSTPESFLARS